MGKQEFIEISLPPEHSENDLLQAMAQRLHISAADLTKVHIVRKSIDARRKHNIKIKYIISTAPSEKLQGLSSLIAAKGLQLSGQLGQQNQVCEDARPLVVGFGPAGIFAALYLALAGLKPIVLERGAPIEERRKDVAAFWEQGLLKEDSNVQYGEGGAGTFSDGKLTTRIKDRRCRLVLEELVMAGAPEEILYLNKPHLGTDLLSRIIIAIRKKIIALGGQVKFNCRLVDLSLINNQLRAAKYLQKKNSQTDGKISYEEKTIKCSRLLLAQGHSAADVLAILQARGVALTAKPFAMGLRIEHPQVLLNQAQYGDAALAAFLGPADYKLAVRLSSGRNVYSFCMCPGGEVVLASSKRQSIVTNGMSYHARDGYKANSALLVNVELEDLPTDDIFAGMLLQRSIERTAWQLAGQQYKIPAQQLKDLLPQSALASRTNYDKKFMEFAESMHTQASCRTGIKECDLSKLFPSYIFDSIIAALPLFEKRLPGFTWANTFLCGPETRSSSPIRIIRDHNFQSSLGGLFPAGEGAGYAGGIMSAAVDGIRCAEALSML